MRYNHRRVLWNESSVVVLTSDRIWALRRKRSHTNPFLCTQTMKHHLSTSLNRRMVIMIMIISNVTADSSLWNLQVLVAETHTEPLPVHPVESRDSFVPVISKISPDTFQSSFISFIISVRQIYCRWVTHTASEWALIKLMKTRGFLSDGTESWYLSVLPRQHSIKYGLDLLVIT